MFRLRSPFLDLRRHLKLDGMQKPGSSGVRKNKQPVVTTHRGCPLLFPRLAIAEKVDLPQASRVCFLYGEIRQKLERRARMEFAVMAGLQQKQTIVVNRAV